MKPILDLKNDLVFKAVFSREENPASKKLLIHLVNLVLKRDKDPITDLVYRNPFTINDRINSKAAIFDVKATTDLGEIIDLEMQMMTYADFPKRIFFYYCKLQSDGLHSGEKHSIMKPVRVICFVNGIQFPEYDGYCSKFSIMEETAHIPMYNTSQMSPASKAAGSISDFRR